MKRVFLYITIVALFSGCVSEDIETSGALQPPTEKPGVDPIDSIRVSIALPPQSRVGIDVTPGVVDKYYWMAGDQIVLCELSGSTFTGRNHTYTLQSVPATHGAPAYFIGTGLDGAGSYVAVHTRNIANVALPAAGATNFVFSLPSTLEQRKSFVPANADVVQAFADNLLFTSARASGISLSASGVSLQHRLAQVETSIKGDPRDNGKQIEWVELDATKKTAYSPSLSFNSNGVPTPLPGGGATPKTIVTDPDAKLSDTTPYVVRMLACPHDATIDSIKVRIKSNVFYGSVRYNTSKQPAVGKITTLASNFGPTFFLTNPPFVGAIPYIGAFWKKNETGERLIRISVGTHAENLGPWTAKVAWMDGNWTPGDVVLSLSGTDDGMVSYSSVQTPNPAENYSVTGNATSVSGTAAANGHIYFRIGLKTLFSTHPSYDINTIPARYAVILLTYGTPAKEHLLFLRQGEDADRVRWETDSPRFAVYNVRSCPSVNNGVFTDFPTQTGAFKFWTTSTKMYKPYEPIPDSDIKTDRDSTYIANVCPSSYKIPTGESPIYDPSTSQISALVYNQPTMPMSSCWGYYADGFFDRRMIVNSPTGAINTTVAALSDNIGYVGRLTFNANTAQSIFLPAAGQFDANGKLDRAGSSAVYWSSSYSSLTTRFNLYLTDSSADHKKGSRVFAFLIRCIR